MTEGDHLLLILFGVAVIGIGLTIALMFIGVAGFRHYGNWTPILPGPNEPVRAWARRVTPTVILVLVMMPCVLGLSVALLGSFGDFTISIQSRWFLGVLSAALAILVGLLYGRAFDTMERRKP